MSQIKNQYKAYITNRILKEYKYIAPAVFFVIALFIYSDIYLLGFPQFVYPRIPLLILVASLFFIRFSYFKKNLPLINVLSIASAMSIIIMGVFIVIFAKEDKLLYRSTISGLIVDTFTAYFLVRGRKNIYIAFIAAMLLSIACISLFLKPSFLEAREFLNVIAIYICVTLMSIVAERNRFNEFSLRKKLGIEKEKSEKLTHATLSQNEELKQQKEVILSINDKLEQQSEELQVNLELISELNGSLNKKNKAITDSLNYARRIQEAILPSSEFISQLFINSFVLFKPCDIVSGDFYWFKETPKYRLVAAVDCTGHGVPGAFMSMLGYSLLNEITEYGDVNSANEILNQLKLKLKESLNQTSEIGALSDGLDIALCMIDVEHKKLQFAGAFMPLCIVRNNEVVGIKGDRMPIGRYIKEIDSFTNHEVDIMPNDVFYLYSDGYQDQIGGKEKKRFLSQNLKRVFLEIHQKPFEQQKVILDTTLNNWRDGLDQIDDVLVVGFRL